MQTSPETQKIAKKYGELIARTWTDAAFKKQFMSDPKGTLKANGFQIPDDVQITVVEDTDKVVYLPLPPKPPDELTDEQLEAVAGGATSGCAGTAGTMSTFACFCAVSTVGCAGTAGTASTN